ncbi:MAG TPA: hypothetical protein VJX10_13790 [Pseudonocardiaceae bacterium]|nr:hypothetical protein [Pseudonocardiaceae bacterium]
MTDLIAAGQVPGPCFPSSPRVPHSPLRTPRVERTTRLQEISHARRDVNHLPDGPEQQARDAALAGSDPLARNGWIYGYDAEAAPSAQP